MGSIDRTNVGFAALQMNESLGLSATQYGFGAGVLFVGYLVAKYPSVLLFEAFKTVKSAALILLNVPFALIGGILALYLTGIHLSVSAAIGFIALFGQAVLNGVVMVSHFNERQEAGESPFTAVFEGAQTRLRTVLMTSMLAMLGLLPMALSHAIGSEVQRPLAVVIIGGLGSIPGVLTGAFLYGVLNYLTFYYLPSIAPALIFGALILLLLWRPQGLFSLGAVARK